MVASESYDRDSASLSVSFELSGVLADREQGLILATGAALIVCLSVGV